MRITPLRYVVFALLVVTTPLWFLAPPTPAQQQTETFVRVGAWNIEWLGNPSMRRGPGQNVPQKAEHLADYIQQSKVDILGLEEITDNDGADDTYSNKTIGQALELVNKETKQQWRHVLFPHAEDPKDGKDQLCGIAWNTDKVSQVGDALKIQVDRPVANAWKRHPHAVKFSLGKGKTDIVVIVVHMKSNRDGAPKGRKVRHEEAKSLMAQLAKVQQHFKDFDFLIMGDTNILKGNEQAVDVFKAFGFRDLNANDEPTYQSGAPFDRFFVPSNQPEFAGADQETFDDAYIELKKKDNAKYDRTQFRRECSDHFMVVTQVRVLEDDDD